MAPEHCGLSLLHSRHSHSWLLQSTQYQHQPGGLAHVPLEQVAECSKQQHATLNKLGEQFGEQPEKMLLLHVALATRPPASHAAVPNEVAIVQRNTLPNTLRRVIVLVLDLAISSNRDIRLAPSSH
jgi:hypothetical protein